MNDFKVRDKIIEPAQGRSRLWLDDGLIGVVACKSMDCLHRIAKCEYNKFHPAINRVSQQVRLTKALDVQETFTTMSLRRD